jgi:hypothetical protein
MTRSIDRVVADGLWEGAGERHTTETLTNNYNNPDFTVGLNQSVRTTTPKTTNSIVIGEYRTIQRNLNLLHRPI